MTAFRQGDIVSVTGKIRHTYNEDEKTVFIDLDGYHSPIMLSVDRVTLIAPRIDVGERVRWTNNVVGEVKASDGDKLWVLTGVGQYVTWPAKDVTILPPDVVTVHGPIDQVTHDRLKSEMAGADRAKLEEPPPAPCDGKVGSEEEA